MASVPGAPSATLPTNSTAVVQDAALIHGFTHAAILELFQRCVVARERAYCPYSNFAVGSTVIIKPQPETLNAPSSYSGANIENASYPVGTCAERVALGTAVVDGVRYGMIRAIGVVTMLDTPCSPCGMCRQFIREFCEPSVPVFMFTRVGEWEVKTVEELLPLSFGPAHLAEAAALRKDVPPATI